MYDLANERVLLALGSNVSGTWGGPPETLIEAIEKINDNGVRIEAYSPVFITRPFGNLRQPDFLNLVIRGRSKLSPLKLLRLAKDLERCAGRRRGMRNGPRPLDIDLLDFGGRVINWPNRRNSGQQAAYPRGPTGAGPTGAGAPRGLPQPPRLRQRPALMLPHPLITVRPFAVAPLAAVEPNWVHPVFGTSVHELLIGLGGMVNMVRRGDIIGVDSLGDMCKEGASRTISKARFVPRACTAPRENRQ